MKEVLDVNAKLKKEKEIFFHQASIIDFYFDSNKILIQKIAIQKLECERLAKKINEYIQWKASESGKEVDLPQVDKFHKEILFKYWEAQIKQAEKAAAKT